MKVKSLLEKKGIPIKEFGKALGLGQTQISRLLNHDEWPKTKAQADIIALGNEYLIARGYSSAQLDKVWAVAATTAGKSINGRRHSMPRVALTQAASDRFKLPQNPFVDDVSCADDVYVSRQQAYVYQTMLHTVRQNGFTAVIGERGAGKTLMMKKMFKDIKAQGDQVVLVTAHGMVGEDTRTDKKRVTMASIMNAIIVDTSRETPRIDLEYKTRQVKRIVSNLLSAANGEKTRVCVVIDEAHLLWKNTLKGLKRLRDMSDGFEPLIGVLLIGQPELSQFLDERYSPDTAEVALRCVQAHLKPLSQDEMHEYIGLKFGRVGASAEQVLDNDAYAALHKKLQHKGESITHPLLVNNTLIAAMNYCATQPAAVYKRVNAELLQGI